MNNSCEEDIIWCAVDRFHEEAASHIKSVSSVLDIGCGIRPQQYICPEILICVEPHLEYVEILKRNLNGSNAVIITSDAITALRGMPDCSIDSIFLIDVIEHMEKNVGAQVVIECERVARQQVIIFTPLGFMPQEIHAGALDGWNLHGGEWQDHKSGWYPEDFQNWTIVACKHLHTHDYLGHPIDPPYGGFYAILNKVKTANLFNGLYSVDTLESKISRLSWINELYPDFVEKVVSRDIESSVLRCGLLACQRTTELQIELKEASAQDDVVARIALEKAEMQRQEARLHHERMRRFALQFAGLNEPLQQFAAPASSAEELRRLEARLELMRIEQVEQQSLLENQLAELVAREQLMDRREAELRKITEAAEILKEPTKFNMSKRIWKLFK